MSVADYSVLMRNEISIRAVEIDGEDGLIVTFSVGTITGHVMEELLELRPRRERVRPKSKNKQALQYAAQPGRGRKIQRIC